jgi:hypothetical protein
MQITYSNFITYERKVCTRARAGREMRKETFLFRVALRYGLDNVGVKKVSALSKNPSKCPIICFAREEKKSPGISKPASH